MFACVLLARISVNRCTRIRRPERPLLHWLTYGDLCVYVPACPAPVCCICACAAVWYSESFTDRYQCVRIRVGSICDEQETFFGFKVRDENGAETTEQRCKHCTACESYVSKCTYGITFIYLSMLQMSDTVLSNDHYRSTQETIVHYLMNQQPDVIMFNTGLHSVAHTPAAVYAQQLQQFLYLLKAVGKLQSELYAFTVTNIYKPKQPVAWHNATSQEKIMAYNVAALPHLRQFDVNIIDTYRISSSFPYLPPIYSDGVHLHGHDDIYYHTVMDMFLDVKCRTIFSDY